ncbi:MAG: GAF domain-containing protein [Bacteroidales bacterium]|nr:GAF domain-containing protein [Bacteroidales bacterium]
MSDFAPYEPSDNEMTMFVSAPVYIAEATGSSETLKAVLIAQISSKSINQILQQRNALLKKTGETFLMGLSDLSKIEMRSTRSNNEDKIGDLKANKFFEAALIKGETGIGEKVNTSGSVEYISYAPLNLRDVTWAVFTTISADEVYNPIKTIWIKNSIGALLILIIIVIGGIYLSGKISGPIIDIKNKLELVSKGILPKQKYKIKSHSEIGQIQAAFNELVEGQKKYIDFANKIGDSKIATDFNKLSDEDMLGEALIKMKESLEKSERIAKEQQLLEAKQRWMTEGVAKFGDILRQNYEGLTKLCDNIVKNLTHFLDVNQAGIFLYDDTHGTPKIKLLSCFAYDRKKYLNKEITPGEGLIGACFNEKETIYLKNIPADYPTISSGLGSAIPKAVLIVPLKIDTKVLGILELVSFKDFEKYDISFTEKIAENIASSIASSQINERTQVLLEESKQKSEQMATQEEEMRQNMEELQATQEENERKEAETSSILDAVNRSVLIATYSLEGVISQMNYSFLNVLCLSEKEVLGLEYKLFNKRLDSQTFWEDLQNDNEAHIVSKIMIGNKEVVLNENFYTIRNTYDEPVKIINIAYQIS